MRIRGLALVDLLATVIVVGLVIGLLVPALRGASTLGRQAGSFDNLRTLGAAHAVYALDWNGRQLTFIVDDASTYGNFLNWYQQYAQENGGDTGDWFDPNNHPPIRLGWGRNASGAVRYFMYSAVQAANAGLVVPINFDAPGTVGVEYFGSSRFANAQQFNQYLGGRFYDEVFYAPVDDVVIDAVEGGFDDPFSYWTGADVQGPGSIPGWSSYMLSPASMFDRDVMRHDDPDDPDSNGWQDPWTLDHAFLSPGLFGATYPSLKTHMLEHHWLQNRPSMACNPLFDPGTYGDPGCEPFYFNHGLDSTPSTLFYDGSVRGVRVYDAIADDEQVRAFTGNPNWGLWSQDTPWNVDGYLSQYGYDAAETSFHVLTTDGIEGRDVLENGVRRPVSTTRPPRTVAGPRLVRRSGADGAATLARPSYVGD